MMQFIAIKVFRSIGKQKNTTLLFGGHNIVSLCSIKLYYVVVILHHFGVGFGYISL